MRALFLLFLCQIVSDALAQTPPSIVAPPTNQAVIVGQSATFSVGVAGTGPFKYRWQLNGEDIAPINTIAGNGNPGFSGDGQLGTAATILPGSLAVDIVGNLYIADINSGRIRLLHTNGIIETVAGGGPAYSMAEEGGSALAFGFGELRGIALDKNGALFIADNTLNRVFRMDTNGTIRTVAGNGKQGFSGDGGPATNASLNWPDGLTIDGVGNLFIADTFNFRVRKVDPNGIISTVAGDGLPSYPFNGVPATNTAMIPNAVAVDEIGNLFIADNDSGNIRRVDSLGLITMVYSWTNHNEFTPNGFVPVAITTDTTGNLFVADWADLQILKIDPAGQLLARAAGRGAGVPGPPTSSGDGGQATLARLKYCQCVVLDQSGNMYISDFYRVRKVTYRREPILDIPAVGYQDAGNYTVVVEGPSGVITNASASLRVLAKPGTLRATSGSGTTGTVISGSADKVYIIESTASLIPPVAWTPIFTNGVDAMNNWTITNGPVTQPSARYFRMRSP
jgi:streptogramin lyase